MAANGNKTMLINPIFQEGEQLDNKTRQKKEQKTVFGNAFNSGSKQGE
jgi:hypothetical protein